MANEIKTWVELNRKLLDQAREIINATAQPSNIWRGARLEEGLAPVADDVVVAGGMTKAQATAIDTMWRGFKYWIDTPMAAFTALFGLVPLIMDYGTAQAALAAATDQPAIDEAQAAVDVAQADLLAAALTVAETFSAGGDTPFNVIFGGD